MRFTIEKEVFLRGLARVQGIVEKKNTIPILANVLLEATKGELQLTATDLEVGMKSSYPAEIGAPGKISVSAKKLFEIVKELPDLSIEFHARENCWIEIRCGKSLFNIVGLSAEEFPYFPNFHKDQFFNLESNTIKKMIDKTLFSISTDESKYNLSGIYFISVEEEGKNYLRLVATDGHRLSLIQENMDVTKIQQLNKGVIFPRKGIYELRKIADENEDSLMMGFFDNNAVVQKNNTVIVIRLIDGEFPDYKRVIPKENNIKLKVDKIQFLHALKRMSILSSDKSKGIKIELREGEINMSSSNPEIGDAKEDIDVDYTGENLSLGFNSRYIIDIVNSQEEKEICLSFRDKISPVLITSCKNDNYLAVVMPMRL